MRQMVESPACCFHRVHDCGDCSQCLAGLSLSSVSGMWCLLGRRKNEAVKGTQGRSKFTEREACLVLVHVINPFLSPIPSCCIPVALQCNKSFKLNSKIGHLSLPSKVIDMTVFWSVTPFSRTSSFSEPSKTVTNESCIWQKYWYNSFLMYYH